MMNNNKWGNDNMMMQHKKVEGRMISQKPLARQAVTELPSLQVPGALRPRQHRPHLGGLLSNWALNSESERFCITGSQNLNITYITI